MLLVQSYMHPSKIALLQCIGDTESMCDGNEDLDAPCSKDVNGGAGNNVGLCCLLML